MLLFIKRATGFLLSSAYSSLLELDGVSLSGPPVGSPPCVNFFNWELDCVSLCGPPVGSPPGVNFLISSVGNFLIFSS